MEQIEMAVFCSRRFLRNDIDGRTVKLLDRKGSADPGRIRWSQGEDNIDIVRSAVLAVSHGGDRTSGHPGRAG
jgi:hypothetical protein